MKKALPTPFIRIAVQTETRLLIRSTCVKCGASKLVSMHDGSMLRWEQEHKCEVLARAR